MKQYLILIYDGYAESCTLTNITLFCCVEDNQNVTPLEIANLFKEAVNQYLIEEEYPEDIKKMFSWDMDRVGSLWEFIQNKGFSFTPFSDIPITKIITLDEIINYITDCDKWSFKKENYNKVTNQPHCFEEKIILK